MSEQSRQYTSTYKPLAESPDLCPGCGEHWRECSCPKCNRCKQRIEECGCLHHAVMFAEAFVREGHTVHGVSMEPSGAVVQEVSREGLPESRVPDLDAGVLHKRRHFPLAYTLRSSLSGGLTGTFVGAGVRVEVARRTVPDGRLEVHIIIDEALEGGLKEPLRAAEPIAQAWVNAVREVQRPQGPRDGFARVHDVLLDSGPGKTARQRQAAINAILSARVLEYAVLSEQLDDLFPVEGPPDPLSPWSRALFRMEEARLSVHWALRHFNKRTSDKGAALKFRAAFERAKRGDSPFPEGQPVTLYQVQQRERERRERR